MYGYGYDNIKIDLKHCDDVGCIHRLYTNTALKILESGLHGVRWLCT